MGHILSKKFGRPRRLMENFYKNLKARNSIKFNRPWRTMKHILKYFCKIRYKIVFSLKNVLRTKKSVTKFSLVPKVVLKEKIRYKRAIDWHFLLSDGIAFTIGVLPLLRIVILSMQHPQYSVGSRSNVVLDNRYLDMKNVTHFKIRYIFWHFFFVRKRKLFYDRGE